MALSATFILGACGRNTGTVSFQPSVTPNDSPSIYVVGGQDVAYGSELANSTVALLNVDSGSLCTASIISSDAVVTAAHCVSGAVGSLRVVFGTQLNPTDRGNTVLNVSDMRVSPIWDVRQGQETNRGDLAIVRFKGAMPIGYGPVAVLSRDDSTALQAGVPVEVAGFGTADPAKHFGLGQLRQAQLHIRKTDFSETEILLDQSQGQGVCHGDSGGPAFVEVRGVHYLFGVTSKGVNDQDSTDTADNCKQSSAFTNLLPYAKWIQGAIDDMRADADKPSVIPVVDSPLTAKKS
jgi:secreted trypsin-like serine protease